MGIAPLNWPGVLRIGVFAGVTGAWLFAAYEYLALLRPQGSTAASAGQFMASTAFGKAALAEPRFAAVGFLLYLVVCLAWGVGYAYLAASRPAVNARPVLSGIAFGFVVFVVMGMALATVGALHYAGLAQIGLTLLGYCVFLGLPIALVTRALAR